MSIILRKFRALLAPLAVMAIIALAPISASAQFADQATYIATPGGTANAITLAVDNWNINRPGVVLRFLPAAQNTGATTVVVNGVGSPIAIRKPTGNGMAALTGGEINTTEIAEIVYDGTYWELRSSPQNPSEPQGYLTPCQVSSPSPVAGCTAGYPFTTSSVSSATTLYYEGVNGKFVPIFNGGQFVQTAVTEAQMTLILSATANTANNLYDVCVYNNAGTPAIGTMPAWSNAGGGTSARSAAISQVQGIWLNTATATVTNNNVGVSVAANRCTIVATILIDGVNGQVSLHRAAGQSRRWGIWNFYNQQPISLAVTDATSSWTYQTTTYRPANGNTANSLTVLTGLPGMNVTAYRYSFITGPGSNSGSANIGIGLNNTASPTGMIGNYAYGAGVPVTGSPSNQITLSPIAMGVNVLTALEYGTTGGGNLTWSGTASLMGLVANWRG